jgi:DNA-directed RNA polymerase specialized sigma24 family protein
MTVSRKGKRGNRAGIMRPSSRNKRVLRNASYKNVAKALDMRPTGKRVSKEEMVIRIATRVVGTKMGDCFVQADDVISDILLELLDAGGFNWEEGKIEDFCRKKASYKVLKYVCRRERSECEFSNADGEERFIIREAGSVSPPQDNYVDARNAVRCLRAIPDRQRQALEILCGGGNPINVAEEMGITPWAAITLIKEGREYVDRVDPVVE